MIRIIKRCDVCRIAMNDGEFLYLVPLNFGLDIQDGQVYLYFHGALEGKKMDCNHKFIFHDDRMSCTMGYESIIGHGIMEFVKKEQKFDATIS